MWVNKHHISTIFWQVNAGADTSTEFTGTCADFSGSLKAATAASLLANSWRAPMLKTLKLSSIITASTNHTVERQDDDLGQLGDADDVQETGGIAEFDGGAVDRRACRRPIWCGGKSTSVRSPGVGNSTFRSM